MPYRETTRVLQRDVLMAAGYDLPRYGADGYYGPETEAALRRYMNMSGEPLTQPGKPPVQPGTDFPNLDDAARRNMRFITLHWSAGSYTIRDGDDVDDHYHYAFDKNGGMFVCQHKPSDNININDHYYAAHTRRANTDNIGLSCAAMFGADVNWGTNKIDPGPYPLTDAQVDAMCAAAARLASECNIPITRETVLSHAEWPITHGVHQNNKWDFQWLPGWTHIRGPIATGDILRSKIKEFM